ncbi:TolC family outer membrane protein [Pseudomonas fluorescens]|uniref:TolC family outer membrane protein n=1 Tax=Pseudomonas fluorescens TaxID=294 RepID=UPI002ACA1F41|nr:TolC family outer membrane protein [Pseudomonas fluorescens]MDZ5436305.1 TolC family outer membrane protein [Pseudomonas fluorescens]
MRKTCNTITPYNYRLQLPNALTKAIWFALFNIGWSTFTFAAVKPEHTDLIDIYNEAAINNAELSAARHHYESLKEKIPQARAGLLPTINSSAKVADVNQESPYSKGARTGSVFQANLTQPLFRSDRWFHLEVAHASVAKTELEFKAKEQSLIITVAQTYLEALRALDTLAASKAEETALQRQNKRAQGRLVGGAASVTDLLDASAAFDNANANRKLAERKVEDALGQLSRLTGQNYEWLKGIGHQLPVLPPDPPDVNIWIDQAIENNPLLQASSFSVDVAEHTIRQRKAGFAPTLDTVISYRRGNDAIGINNDRGHASQRSIALELNIPLYSGGMVRSQVREATEQLAQSQQEREDRRRETILNTRQLYRTVNSDIEQIEAKRQSIRSSRTATLSNKIGWERGIRNFSDVLNAQRLLFIVVREYNNARYDYIINTLKLKQAAGILSPLDLQSLNTYLSKDYDFEKDFLPPDIPS